jgi:hypothetical protein
MKKTLQFNQLTKESCPLYSPNNNKYKYLLGITSDGLYILNLELTLMLEIIVDGNSKDCTVCSTPDEDSFLDAILFIKNILKDGGNPLNFIDIY